MKQLNFAEERHYEDDEDGIPILVKLTYAGTSIEVTAKVDTGSAVCLFSHEDGLDLGIPIEQGIPRRLVFHRHQVMRPPASRRVSNIPLANSRRIRLSFASEPDCWRRNEQTIHGIKIKDSISEGDNSGCPEKIERVPAGNRDAA